MRFPTGKGFDLACDMVVTVVLDNVTLIGTFLGEIEERHHDDPTYVDVDVDNEDEFILLKLLHDVEINNVETKEGTIVAVNIGQIQFIAPGGECKNDKKHHKK
jgi:hypothetical protein